MGLTGAATAVRLDRGVLLRKIDDARNIRRDWLRRQIVEFGRVDLLASEVLGYDVVPHHLDMLKHAARYPDGNLLLGFRGSGKTTVRTIAKAIHVLLRAPNARVLIASRSSENAKAMLGEIKRHFEGTPMRELFGDWIGRRWEETAITVRPRTSPAKEASVAIVGTESAVVSMHYDVILADDLVDEENARTRHMRGKLHTWYYKSLLPTLEPGGELHVHGTRYHHEDLYGHLMGAEMCGGRTLRVPALVGNERDGWASVWPDKWPTDKLVAMRRHMGIIIFDSQFQCDTRAMVSGGVFDVDDLPVIPASAVPEGLPCFIGVDLAPGGTVTTDATGAGRKDPDSFAMAAIRHDSTTDKVYVVDHLIRRVGFTEQRRLIVEFARRHSAAKTGCESNSYQGAMIGELRRQNPDVVVVPLHTHLGKDTRAWRLQGRAQDHRLIFAQGNEPLIAQFVAYPHGDHDDGFDAVDLAIRVGLTRARKPRDSEPGLL